SLPPVCLTSTDDNLLLPWLWWCLLCFHPRRIRFQFQIQIRLSPSSQISLLWLHLQNHQIHFFIYVSIVSLLLIWRRSSSSQLSDFIKQGFVTSEFVAVMSPNVHVKILPTALKRGGFGRLIYGKCEARDSHSSSISLCIGPSLADVVLTMLEALQSAKTCRLSSLQLLLDSTVLFSAMRSWLDLIKITCFLCRKLFTLFTPLSFNLFSCCSHNECCTQTICRQLHLSRASSPPHLSCSSPVSLSSSPPFCSCVGMFDDREDVTHPPSAGQGIQLIEPTTEAFHTNDTCGWENAHGGRKGTEIGGNQSHHEVLQNQRADGKGIAVSPSRFSPLQDIVEDEEDEEGEEEILKEVEDGEILESKAAGKKVQRTQAVSSRRSVAVGKQARGKVARSKDLLYVGMQGTTKKTSGRKL
ncbi:hypothetical protein HID58_025846, partial [Brassica napus]